jgi:hypothetical protein
MNKEDDYEAALRVWRFSPAGSEVFRDVKELTKLSLRLAELKQQIGADAADRISERVGHLQVLNTKEYWEEMKIWANK